MIDIDDSLYKAVIVRGIYERSLGRSIAIIKLAFSDYKLYDRNQIILCEDYNRAKLVAFEARARFNQLNLTDHSNINRLFLHDYQSSVFVISIDDLFLFRLLIKEPFGNILEDTRCMPDEFLDLLAGIVPEFPFTDTQLIDDADNPYRPIFPNWRRYWNI